MKKCIFFLFILLIGCTKSHKNEALYFFYHGDQRISYYHLVLKSDSSAYANNLMFVGKPIEFIIDKNDLSSFQNKINEKYLLTEKNKREEGICIIHYVEKNIQNEYIFVNRKELDYLLYNLKFIKNSEVKNKVIDWAKAIENMHPLKYQ